MPPVSLSYKTDADVVKTEGPNRLSRDEVVLATGAPIMRPGAILVRGGDGTYTRLAGAPGAGAVLGVLLENVPAVTTAARRVVVLSRHAEVVLQSLEWPAGASAGDQSAAIAALEGQLIVTRNGV